MISKDDFSRLLQDVCYLIGYPNPPREQKALFYRKLCNYDLRDFEAACNDDAMIAQLSRIRNLDYTTLKSYILRYQIQRQDREEARKKKEWEEGQKRLMQDEQMPDEIRKFIRGFGN